MNEKNVSEWPVQGSPEDRILAAAAEEFAGRGFFGGRTHSIAESAGVNKAMLHYYFRTKENLYGQVIRAAFYRILVKVGQAWSERGSIEARVEKVVDSYMDHYEKNPGVLRIVLREVVDGGERLRRIFKEIQSSEPAPGDFSALDVIDRVSDELNLSRSEVVHYVVNLVGMCAFSFISPLLLETLIHFQVPDFQAYLKDRRSAIKAMALSHVKAVIAESTKRSQI